MAEPNGAGLESQVGTVSRAEGIRHDPRRKTHSDSLGAHKHVAAGLLATVRRREDEYSTLQSLGKCARSEDAGGAGEESRSPL